MTSSKTKKKSVVGCRPSVLGFVARREGGFTLMETIIAIFILTVGVTGAVSLVSTGAISLKTSSNRMIATNLAQEGLEIAHNIRDTNWLSVSPWNDWDGNTMADDCVSPECEYYASWNSLFLSSDTLLQNIRWNQSTGHYDDAGDGGEIFSRKIIILDNPDEDSQTQDVSIKSAIGWGGPGNCNEGGVPAGTKYCLTLEERLYDWR